MRARSGSNSFSRDVVGARLSSNYADYRLMYVRRSSFFLVHVYVREPRSLEGFHGIINQKIISGIVFPLAGLEWSVMVSSMGGTRGVRDMRWSRWEGGYDGDESMGEVVDSDG